MHFSYSQKSIHYLNQDKHEKLGCIPRKMHWSECRARECWHASAECQHVSGETAKVLDLFTNWGSLRVVTPSFVMVYPFTLYIIHHHSTVCDFMIVLGHTRVATLVSQNYLFTHIVWDYFRLKLANSTWWNEINSTWISWRRCCNSPKYVCLCFPIFGCWYTPEPFWHFLTIFLLMN